MQWQALIQLRYWERFQQLCCWCRARELQMIQTWPISEELGEKSLRTSPSLAAAQAISGLNLPEAMLRRSPALISPYLTAISAEEMQSMRLYFLAVRSCMSSRPTLESSLRKGILMALIFQTICMKLKLYLSNFYRVRKGLCVPFITWNILILPMLAAQKFQSYIATISSIVISFFTAYSLLSLTNLIGRLSCDSDAFFSIKDAILLYTILFCSGDTSRKKSFFFSSLTASTIFSLVVWLKCLTCMFPLRLRRCYSSSMSLGDGATFCVKEKGFL